MSSLMSIDDDPASFRFLPSQLEVFRGLVFSMVNCSRALAALAVGNVVFNSIEAVEHAHHAHHAAEATAVAAGSPGAMAVLTELAASVSLGDVAFCMNAIIPAALISYAAGPFVQLAQNPDRPHMELALQGVGRLSMTLQQLAWTSGSVGVVLLLEAAVKYPPMVGVASGACLALAAARGAALWWVVRCHTNSGEEVAATLAAVRGGEGAKDLPLVDRAAAWLAMGALLEAEPSIHHHKHGSHGKEHDQGHGHGAGTALLPGGQPHYSFDLSEERVLRSLVEGANAAGLAIALQVLATLSLGVADAATGDASGLVSNLTNGAQKGANAALLFAASAAFDKALHNQDGQDDTNHLLSGLGVEHSGMSGLFTSMAVLSWALLAAGALELVLPSLLDSPLGILVGEKALHVISEVVIEALEAI
ncbi:hypothetical protein HYH03_012308 [Edaphochlamys debaryana]|uniref:Uncharacterized protein n=1 Tax=Edaphochlamys debaryana TaxID=47281 RepID=A0A835XS97_9CHLO|nr:hypothetical protein HYH03_012308 [Edaphochlamys debaryana]|eukprot:KAG2489288.1 hypothetical protein HYH03_012308 [Edaphochlamys debaryana]